MSPTDPRQRIGAVVLQYRFWPHTKATIDALLTQELPPDHVVVVDNASGDGSVEEIRRSLPLVEVVEADDNRGYGAGMNLGLERLEAAGADAVLLLTQECLLAPGALGALSQRLSDDPSLGAVGPLLAYRSRPDTLQSAGGLIDRRTWHAHRVRLPARLADWVGRDPHRVDWLNGAAMLLRTEAVRAAGPIDDQYFLYFEEVDYCQRLRNAGWLLECVPAALAWQEPGHKGTYLSVRNSLRFVARTGPRRLVVREAVRQVVFLARAARRQGISSADVVARRRAMVDALLRRWGRPPSGRDPESDARIGGVITHAAAVEEVRE
jgi:GT2 family glycosyltransferase